MEEEGGEMTDRRKRRGRRTLASSGDGERSSKREKVRRARARRLAREAEEERQAAAERAAAIEREAADAIAAEHAVKTNWKQNKEDIIAQQVRIRENMRLKRPDENRRTESELQLEHEESERRRQEEIAAYEVAKRQGEEARRAAQRRVREHRQKKNTIAGNKR